MNIFRLALAGIIFSIVASSFGQAAKAEPFKLNGDPKPAWLYFDVKSENYQRVDPAQQGPAL